MSSDQKTESPSSLPGSDGEGINVFYTGLPPYHPLAIAEGWDPELVDKGVRNDAIELVKAGYNVYVIGAGPEIPIAVIAEKMREKGVQWHITGIGMGIRASSNPLVIHRLEDLVQVFRRDTPTAQQVFNSGPRSCLESVQYRTGHIRNEGHHGKLLGYEELFDGRKGQPLDSVPSSDD
ncbi:hypothetical protein CCHR01_18562 [Colletotrichum chrysophilum]|uniref:Uncharacterized protein n=1 Tax=Colletotrichum chrysophilum TaxID=1836956 RepID=A0AAD9A0H4_9PEZI|nr:hypothetical protein CCHR01_18562 [Colletotrichum chrysophilum]